MNKLIGIGTDGANSMLQRHTWFSNSPNRINKYTELYKVLKDRVPKKVPGLASTRWSSRLEAIGVILDQWDSLKLHFEMCETSERCYTAKQLIQAYNDPHNKLYLLYVRKVLKEVVRVNTLFQGQNVEVAKLTEDLIDMYRNIMHMVVGISHFSNQGFYCNYCFQKMNGGVLNLEQWPKSCLESSVAFWAEVYEKLDSAGNRKFPNISAFALALLSLPFSNANVERVFSVMNIVHSKVRNKFSVRSVEAILQIRYGSSLQGSSMLTLFPLKTC
ncbi:uncharacterized protein LOC143017594 [Oratosquilla oratoria]|uniref:uncharacterized protein LOC143017594 n=1 Tax=Oratosquilla oratoria TaxID=337810 RepID=UPI003F759C8E